MTHDIDSVVVGLAGRRAFAVSGRDSIVLGSELAIGTATSSRNREVIHARHLLRTRKLSAFKGKAR